MERHPRTCPRPEASGLAQNAPTSSAFLRSYASACGGGGPALAKWHAAPEGSAAARRRRRQALREERLLPLQAHAPVGDVGALLGPLLGQGDPAHGVEAAHRVAAHMTALVDVAP